MRYSLIVFDWDGHAVRLGRDHRPLAPARLRRPWICRFPHDSGCALCDRPRPARRAAARRAGPLRSTTIPGCPRAIVRITLDRDVDDPAVSQASPELLEALRRARSQHLGVATGKSRRGLDRGAGADGHCPSVHRDPLRRRKPAETASGHAAAPARTRPALPPESALMIGDTTHDLQLRGQRRRRRDRRRLLRRASVRGARDRAASRAIVHSVAEFAGMVARRTASAGTPEPLSAGGSARRSAVCAARNDLLSRSG